MKKLRTYILIISILFSITGIYSLNIDPLSFNMNSSGGEAISESPEVQAPPQNNQQQTRTQTQLQLPTTESDTAVDTRFPVSKTVPIEYKDITTDFPIDLRQPQNLDLDFEYDPVTNTYILKSEIGKENIVTPFSLTQEEYMRYSMEKSMRAYYRQKNQDEFLNQDAKDDAFSLFDMKFDLGPAEKIFGPGGVQLQANGSATVKMAINHTVNQNPTMTESQRSRYSFEFDEQIQANINAKVGDKVNFGLNYNTESTFDFDTKKIKLAYQGKEDEILKTLEAGNVSMSTSNSLIRGGSALFGIKSELQFGKLHVGAIFSQQESQSQSVSTKKGVQTTEFEIPVDAYDENKHFFLSHYFREKYDEWMKGVPDPATGISIEKIEVWITNTRANYNEARNLIAFSDLGESNKEVLSNPVEVNIIDEGSYPKNKVNTLYEKIINLNVRDISMVTQTLVNFEAGRDYEKLENARKLSESEYELNRKMGYISLKNITLQPDEVIAVAYQYKTSEDTYKVGEFSTDNSTNLDQALYVKLLKGTSQVPSAPYWNLMMKNIYSLNTYSLSSDKFKLNILYQNDTTGTYLNYIPDGDIKNTILLRVMNLDRLDSRNNIRSDGFFDYVEGYTVSSQTGRIIFPVIEPFGSHLKKAIGKDEIAEKYIFQELYDSTLTVAKQIAEKNKFILRGEYKGSSSGGSSSSSGCISLNATSVARGSVKVMADGVLLTENMDYTVDYSMGEVCLLNDNYTNVNVSLENQGAFGMQRKTLMGLDLQYKFNENFSFGGTIMNLREMPLTMKVNMGEESVNNTLFGFNLNYKTQSQWLTNMFDKLPLLNLTAPSTIAFSAEYAQLIPSHYENQYGGNYSFIDDFERTKVSLDMRYWYAWYLASTPYDNSGDALFPEAGKIDDPEYGYNRSLLAWYNIDRLFTRRTSLTPPHIRNDKQQLSDHYVREITEKELFPNKDVAYGESSSLPVLNLAFYPKERGPYNLDAEGTNPDGTLKNPKQRWGGIMRRIEKGYTDFEASNIEYIEFWLMDPFIKNPVSTENGKLYINLGEISEDILKDEKKFYENGLPIDGDTSAVNVTRTKWGLVPARQSLNYAFDNSSSSARAAQDVGLNGLSTEAEKTFDTYKNYLDALENILSPDVLAWMKDGSNYPYNQFSPFNDPSGDNYHYFRGSDYDAMELSILDRYKRFNGTEGNSIASEDSPENYDVSSKSVPDVEDINQDNTLNESEKYFQYEIDINPREMVVGRNFIASQRVASVHLENGDDTVVTWYQFKIPVKEPNKVIGNISDFNNIRFIRMFLHNFQDSIILRFGTLELVKGDWRPYSQQLYNLNQPPISDAAISVSSVSLVEDGGERIPVSYVLPPGVNRVHDPGQTQLVQENEQALSVKITNLSPGDARAVYKGDNLDTRQYRRLQMFAHAEKLADDATDLQNNELSIFLRLGSDYKNNYYEYEIPLKITPPGTYSSNSNSDRLAVWPEDNMFDFLFETFTDLKLERNMKKRQSGSDVTYSTVYSKPDPDKPNNKISIVGNPTISEIKVIMIGVRNNSTQIRSTEVWLNELRLTDFNEDGGWAGNANLNIGVSDFGTFNFRGNIETAGFGGLEQGIMERNLDDYYDYNIATNVELGKLFPEKAAVSLPMYYSYTKQITSPKYDPLNQDVLLKDALDAVNSKAERDSIKSYAQDKVVTKAINFNNIRVNIKSKNPMPYDPANFTFGYSFDETNKQNAETEYERETNTRLTFGYGYSPLIKPFTPFKELKSNSKALKFAKELSFNWLPNSFGFNSDISRNYYEVQLRDLNSADVGGLPLDVSFRDEIYWNRSSNIVWNMTPNLNLSLKTGTEAQVETPAVQANKKLNKGDYEIWKDSVLMNLRKLGTPIAYSQSFSATYNIPFRYFPVLEWISGNLSYNAIYNWDRGAELDSGKQGNTIKNTRSIGIDAVNFNLLNLYNKSEFLREVNQKFTMKTNTSRNQSGSRGDSPSQQRNAETKKKAEEQKKKAELEKKKKRFETHITLNPDSAIVLTHNLDNKRVRVSARDTISGKIYQLKYKSIDKNSIRINNKDSVNLKIVVNQLPKLEETTWYKIAQYASRGLMMVRNVQFSYSKEFGMTIPGFEPNIGDAFGQRSTNFGYAPGFDFAFGLAGENYLDKINEREWLVKDPLRNNPAIFNYSEIFNMKAGVEPFTGMRIDFNASRTNTNSKESYFMEDNPSTRRGGTFSMTTIAIGSAFESSNSGNNYESKAFNKFLNNREIIANRLEQKYANATYPNAKFIPSELIGKPYNSAKGAVSQNSPDVLIPAFLAAYTGKDAGKIKLSAFPSLGSILPNWSAEYQGLMQLDFINKHFRKFSLTHRYNCTYAVGNYSSLVQWADDDNGYGFFLDEESENIIPSSAYDITSVTISESFSPLIGLNAQFRNNTTMKLELRKTRNLSLNISSYQIVEAASNDFVVGVGYKLTEFNQVLKMRSSGGENFSNDLTVSADVTYKKMQSLIRKIQDGYTQATSGDSQTTIKISARYNLSRALTFEAFYDKQISKPLVSSTAYPFSKASFGASLNISLSR